MLRASLEKCRPTIMLTTGWMGELGGRKGAVKRKKCDLNNMYPFIAMANILSTKARKLTTEHNQQSAF